MDQKVASRIARVAIEKTRALGREEAEKWWKEVFSHMTPEDYSQVYQTIVEMRDKPK